jgi:50S ribosome-binding GTPase
VERRRHREGLPKVAIVGYTNAGKSSVMRALTASEVLVADQLFATLDTTVRALQPEPQSRILVSDTVGFIRNLPNISQKALLKKEFPKAIAMSALKPQERRGTSLPSQVYFSITWLRCSSSFPTARKVCSPTSARTSTCSASRTRKRCLSQNKREPRHRYRLEATARVVRTP